MEAHLTQWLNLALRWVHVITGIAWIGTSFYFNWLIARLETPARSEGGVAGELWSVHGGKFFRVVQYQVAPAQLPRTLHWFKWEAYATWLSGAALLVLIYYLGASAYLVDPNASHVSATVSITLGAGSLVASWFLYDALCRSPLGRTTVPFAVVGLLIGTGVAWGLTLIMSSRAAYIHVGAILGTLMAANVFRVIIPNQKVMVGDMAVGRPPDARLGAQAAMRSLHNNYLTLPVLFIMVSNHYPMTYGHRYNWLLLAAIAVVGAGVRHYFNLRNQGRGKVWILPAGVLALLGLALVTRPPAAPIRPGLAEVSDTAAVSFTEVRALIVRRCTPCHSSVPTDPGFPAAPAGVVLDTPQQIRRSAERIYAVAVASETMPLGNLTGMTRDERELLRRWVRGGAEIR